MSFLDAKLIPRRTLSKFHGTDIYISSLFHGIGIFLLTFTVSMAMGVKVPGFQLLSLFPPSETNGQSFFDAPCFLPDQIGIYLSVYVPFILLSLAALFASNYYRVKASDQARTYWSSGDVGESGSVTNSYLDAGAWRATTPTTMDDSQILLRKVGDPSGDAEDEEDEEAGGT